MGQVVGRLLVLKQAGEHAAHGAGVDAAVGLAAGQAIDRAVVEAGGAAQAEQDLLVGTGQDAVAAVIQDDHGVCWGP